MSISGMSAAIPALTAPTVISVLPNVLSSPSTSLVITSMPPLMASVKEATKAAEELHQQWDEEWGEGGSLADEYDALIAKGNALTDVELARLEVLKAQRAELAEQVNEADEDLYRRWQVKYGYLGTGDSSNPYAETHDVEQLRLFAYALKEANEQYDDGIISAKEYYSALQKILSGNSTTVEQLRKFADAGYDISDSQRQMIKAYDELAGKASDYGKALSEQEEQEQARIEQEQTRIEQLQRLLQEAKDLDAAEEKATGQSRNRVAAFYAALSPSERELLENADKGNEVETRFTTPGLEEAITSVGEFTDMLNKLPDRVAVKVIGTAQEITDGPVANITSGAKGFANLIEGLTSGRKAASGTKSAPGGPTLVNELGPELISANGLAWIAGGGKPTVTNLPKGATVLTTAQTRRAVNGLNGVIPAAKGGFTSSTHGIFGTNNQSVMVTDSPSDPGGKFSTITPHKVKPKPSRNVYLGAWTAPTDFKELEKTLDAALKNLNLQAELAENQGDYARMIAMYSTAEDKIAELVQKYRDEGYAEDSDEILTLLNKGYDYSSKRKKLSENLWDDLIESIEGITKATDKANDLAEKEQAVRDAQTSLDNARNQRTVRVFNPVTGQWEWVSNAQDVANAEKNLQSAQEALQKQQLEQELDALKKGDINAVLGPAISAVLNGANEEQLKAFASALHAVSGTADFTPNSGTQNILYGGGKNDSHDTIYSFPGGITLTEEQAKNTTLADLAKQLRVLNIT